MLAKNVDNSNFLWVTRGEKWGFRQLSKCSRLAPYDVDAIYKKLFLSDENRLGYWKGKIVIDNESKYQYVACRCYDDACVQRDEAGRRIPHEFLLLCSIEDCTDLGNLSWGALVIDNIRNQYLELFHCSPNEVGDCRIRFRLETSLERVSCESCESCISLDLSVPSAQTNNNSFNLKFTTRFWCLILLVFLILCFAFYNKLRRNPKECQRIIDNREIGESRSAKNPDVNSK